MGAVLVHIVLATILCKRQCALGNDDSTVVF